jgi:hypothetical protein
MERKIVELENSIKFHEHENKIILDSLSKKEQDYIDRIKLLENKLLTSDKKDYAQLVKEKKERENQVYILKNQIQNLSINYAEESNNYKYLVTEMIQKIDDINTEIILIGHSRDQLLEYKGDDNSIINQ